MANLDLGFPTGKSRSVGTQHTVGNFTWEWNGDGWIKVDTTDTPPAKNTKTSSSTKPTSPSNDDEWEDSDNDKKFKYVGEEQVWVEF